MRPRLMLFEIAWTDAAFDAIHPETHSLPHGVRAMHPVPFFEAVLREAPLEQSIGMRLALWMVALAPLFTIGRFGTIASIDAAERVTVLERLLASPLYVVRELALMIKATAGMLYGQSPAVRAAMTTPHLGGRVSLTVLPPPASSGVRLRGGAEDEEDQEDDEDHQEGHGHAA